MKTEQATVRQEVRVVGLTHGRYRYFVAKVYSPVTTKTGKLVWGLSKTLNSTECTSAVKCRRLAIDLGYEIREHNFISGLHNQEITSPDC